MRAPTTVTSDGAPGLINAINAVRDKSIRIRCWFHRLANIRAKLPDETAGEVLAHVYAVRDAPTLDAARAAADRFANTFLARVSGGGRLFHRGPRRAAGHPPGTGPASHPGPHHG